MRSLSIQRPLDVLAVLATVAVATSSVSCNMTGGIDNPKSQPETIADAQDKMDTGDCQGAVNELTALNPANDKSNQMLGTAYLCLAGATANRIDGALGGYNTSSQNLTVVGALANQLVPAAANGDANITLGVAAFNAMGVTTTRSLWQIYGNIVGIANLEAFAAGTGATAVVRSSISATSCLNQNCANVATVATNCPAAGFTDALANEAINYLSAAAVAAQSTTLTTVANLVTTLQGYSATTSAAAMRCVLYNQTLSN